MISKCPNKHSLEGPANRVFTSFHVRKREITNRTRSHQTGLESSYAVPRIPLNGQGDLISAAPLSQSWQQVKSLSHIHFPMMGKWMCHHFWKGLAQLITVDAMQLFLLLGQNSSIKLFASLRIRHQATVKEKAITDFTGHAETSFRVGWSCHSTKKSLADTLQILLAIKHLNRNWLHLYRIYHQVRKNMRKSNHQLWDTTEDGCCRILRHFFCVSVYVQERMRLCLYVYI